MIAWLYEEIERTSALAPKRYTLTPEAFSIFREAYNDLEKRRVNPANSSAMQNVWGKSEGRIGKIAINLHRIEAVFMGQLPSERIGRHTMSAAIALTYFYAQQVQALYALLDGSGSLPPLLAKVLDIAERKGDWITAGDVQLNFTCQKRPRPETVRQCFKELAELNLGTIEGEGRKLKFSISNPAGIKKSPNIKGFSPKSTCLTSQTPARGEPKIFPRPPTYPICPICPSNPYPERDTKLGKPPPISTQFTQSEKIG